MMGHHKIAQAIQEQWQVAFGLRVQLQNKEWKVFLDELNHGDFQIARMGGIASFPDPITFLNEYRYSGGHQFARWHNSEYSALLDKADYCPDNQKRKEFLLAAEQILIDEMPIIPIYYYTGNYLQNPRLKNVHVSEMNDIDFKLSYLEETP